MCGGDKSLQNLDCRNLGHTTRETPYRNSEKWQRSRINYGFCEHSDEPSGYTKVNFCTSWVNISYSQSCIWYQPISFTQRRRMFFDDRASCKSHYVSISSSSSSSARQPYVGPGLPQKLLPAKDPAIASSDFETRVFFQDGVVSPTPNPRLSWRVDVFCYGCLHLAD
jgi:hypothetical protein